MELPTIANSAKQGQNISERKFTVLACLVIVAAVVGSYWQITGHDFVSVDTSLYFTKNPHVRQGLTWEGVKWAFTTTSFGQWYPVTWLFVMLDCELYGLNPRGHHLHNLLLHALNSVLLFLALRALTRTADFNLWACALATALFALHPLRVESVAWAVEIKDMLSGFFWWLALLFYCRYVDSPGIMRYLAVLVAFVLGLMSKPMQITLPFTLLLLDYWPLRRFTWENFHRGNRTPLWSSIAEKVPLFLIAIGFTVFTFIFSLGTAVIDDWVPLSIRMGNVPLAYLHYIEKMFWPVELAFLYPLRLVLPWWKVWPASAILLAITALALWQARAKPYFIIGWLWFMGTLVPVIGIVQAGPQAVADRYTYIPCVGINIIVAWFSVAVVRRRRRLKVVIVPALGLALVALTARTFSQSALWRDSITLYRHTLSVTSDNPVVHSNLGVALDEQGDLAQAACEYEEAIRIFPEYSYAHNNLGMIYVKLGQDREAVSHFTRAIRCRPNHICRPPYVQAHMNLGAAYERLGEYQEAIAAYHRLIQWEPDYAHFRLATIYTLILEPEKAIQELEEMKSDHPGALYYLVVNHLRIGNTRAALEYHRKLSILDPKMADELILSGAIAPPQDGK